VRPGQRLPVDVVTVNEPAPLTTYLFVMTWPAEVLLDRDGVKFVARKIAATTATATIAAIRGRTGVHRGSLMCFLLDAELRAHLPAGGDVTTRQRCQQGGADCGHRKSSLRAGRVGPHAGVPRCSAVPSMFGLATIWTNRCFIRG
jgi:hypothetical protein